MSEKATREQLIELYSEQKLSLAKVAKMFGVCAQTVLNWMRQYGIPRRSLSESWHNKTEEEKHLKKLARAASHHRGKSRWNWKPDGSKRLKEGYVLVKCSGHPRGDWVFEHVMVMEQHLGRYLRDGEEIHHRQDKADNRLENLELFASHSEHLLTHNHRRR